MHYSGFVVMFTYLENHPDKSTHFEGPFAEYSQAEKVYEKLLTLMPTVRNVQIGEIVTNPCNPKLY